MGSGRRVEPSHSSDPAHREIASYESSLAPDHRKQRGVHYTPPELARYLVGRALPRLANPPLRVCDPTCGGGTFLLAVADALADTGVDPVEVIGERIYGADVDAAALALARKLLIAWAEERTGQTLTDASVPGLVQADLLSGVPGEWGGTGFDLVVGNPPFLSQLRSRTTRTAEATQALRERFGSVGPYADTASLILLGSAGMLAEGGVVTMIQPQSFLASRDTAGVRDALLDSADLVELWSSDSNYFDAAVRVCAVTVLRPKGRPGTDVPGRPGHDLESGSDALDGAESDIAGEHDHPTGEAKLTEVTWSVSGEPLGSARRSSVRRPARGESWGPAFAAANGVPVVEPTGGMTLGDVATVTAGFRDEFYALVEACVDASTGAAGEGVGAPVFASGDDLSGAPRLVTVGMIDPCHLTWGQRARRLGGVTRLEPQLDLDHLARSNPSVYRWATGRLVPKVLIATQTRIIEAAVDNSGDCIPVTPVISVEPLPGWETTVAKLGGEQPGGGTDQLPDLWWLLAAVSAPTVAAQAVGQHLGTGLSGGALRVSAKSVLRFELPTDVLWWAQGARAARAAAEGPASERSEALADLGRAMCLAHGRDPSGELFDWWFDRVSAACLTRGGKIV